MATKKTNTEYTGAEVVDIAEVKEKKPALNILDVLLGADMDTIKLPTKEVEITRLSEVFGGTFMVTLQALSASKWEELQDMAVKVQGKDVDLDTNLLQIFVVLESTLDSTGKPLFKNMELCKHFGVATPKELVKKLLLSGEIINLYSAVSTLSGFNDEAIEEVKN